MSIIIVIIILFAVIGFSLAYKKIISKRELLLIVVYTFSIAVFLVTWMLHSGAYNEAVDPVDDCYAPFHPYHSLTVFWYFILCNVAFWLSWKQLEKLSPIVKALTLAVLAIGVILFATVVVQVLYHNTEIWDMYKGNDGTVGFVWLPLILTGFCIYFIIKIIRTEATSSSEKTYKNNLLENLNRFLAKKGNLSWAMIFMMLPVLLVSTLILILLGQQYDSFVRAFTDTALWTFSQHVPPPPLDHRGHYLCTVAAHGSPEIVKPKYIGKRGGQFIIVNRQLQIANAFEELIQNRFPKLHKIIRINYDKYGYNLSQKITTKFKSDITYLMMKPLEFIFLLILYTFDKNPESRVHKQYL